FFTGFGSTTISWRNSFEAPGQRSQLGHFLPGFERLRSDQRDHDDGEAIVPNATHEACESKALGCHSLQAVPSGSCLPVLAMTTCRFGLWLIVPISLPR